MQGLKTSLKDVMILTKGEKLKSGKNHSVSG